MCSQGNSRVANPHGLVGVGLFLLISEQELNDGIGGVLTLLTDAFAGICELRREAVGAWEKFWGKKKLEEWGSR